MADCSIQKARARLPSCNRAGSQARGVAIVAAGSGPLLDRRRLRAELRQARQDARLTQEAVAQEMDWSLSKIIRIENGAVGISANDLSALLRLYGVHDDQRIGQLRELARATRQPTWWSRYRPVLPRTYFKYIEYEASATVIRSYEPLVIPGLLQTSDYASATISNYRRSETDRDVAALVDVRMKRQELLLQKAESPALFFVLDEAAIQRLAAEDTLRRDQLEKLIDLAERPEITLEVIPFTTGLHRGMAENFSILEFPGTADDVIYFESARDGIFMHDTLDEGSVYRELFEELRRISLGPRGTLGFLRHIADATR